DYHTCDRWLVHHAPRLKASNSGLTPGALKAVRAHAPIPRMNDQAKMLENMISLEADATKRAQLEFESKERKRDVDRYKTLAERKREREQQLSSQLRAEQAKLTELEGRLDGLEREIEAEVDRQRTEDAREGKKRP